MERGRYLVGITGCHDCHSPKVKGMTPDMTRALSEESRKSLLGQIPLGRLGTPQDVASAVAYLASDAARYVRGSTLFVDGGWTAVDGPPTGLTQLHK